MTSVGTRIGSFVGSHVGPVERKTSLADILALASGFPVFTSDYYTESLGNVTAFVDHNDPTHLLAQAVFAEQCAEPVAIGGVMNGQPVATINSGEGYQSNRVASAWDFISDGSGFTHFLVYRRLTGNPQHIVMATQSGSSRSTGYDNNHQPDTDNFLALGTSATVSQIAVAAESDTYVSHSISGNPTRSFEAWERGIMKDSGTTTAGGAAAAPLSLNRDTAGGFSGDMYFAALMFFPPLSVASRKTVQRYIWETYGVTP
jgi:hypothetical protein